MSRPVMITLFVLATLIAGTVWWLEELPPAVSRQPDGSQEQSFGAVGNSSPDSQKITLRPFVATPENSRAAQVAAGGKLLVADIAATTHALNAPDATVEQDLEIVQNVIAFYRRASDSANPGGGLNEEIVDQLRGKNPKRLAVLPPDHPGIDHKGRLLDRWGTPYWFHPVARQELEIRSAGPDRQLWTADDVQVGGENVTGAKGLAGRERRSREAAGDQ